MLPPIPQGLIPVTVQQDQPRPKPAVKPVAPAQDSAGAGGVALKNEGERRKVKERPYAKKDDPKHQAENEEDDDLEENAETPSAKSKGMSRRGLWIDIKV